MKQKKKEYNKYLKSNEWYKKRIEAYALFGYECQRCGVKRSLCVHHKTYARFKNEDVKKDFAILCNDCHDLYHMLYSHTGIKTTNDFIKDRTTPKLQRSRIRRLKAPVNKKLLFQPQRTFTIKGRSIRFAKTKLHNPKEQVKVEYLDCG